MSGLPVPQRGFGRHVVRGIAPIRRARRQVRPGGAKFRGSLPEQRQPGFEVLAHAVLVGKAVAALARGDFPYSTGQIIMVDGGMTLPRL